MNKPLNETKLRHTAVSLPYPPTPPIGLRFWQQPKKAYWLPQRVALGFALLLMLLITAAVPPVRAWLSTIFRIGTVTVIVEETPQEPLSTPIPLLDLPGLTTLAEAQAAVPFFIQRPSSLPEPDSVYYSDAWQGLVTLVWQDEALILQILDFNILGTKIQIEFAEETAVNNLPALWIEAPHLLTLYDERVGSIEGLTRQIDGHVLIWAQGGLTYRLETFGTQSEALALAESVMVVR